MGLWEFICLVVAVIIADVAAYFIERLFHKGEDKKGGSVMGPDYIPPE